MAAERQQHEGAVAAAEPSVARRLWRVVRAVLYMLRRGLPSGRKLAMDLHLLLHRGKKIAGKALGDRFLASHHGRGHGAAAFSYAGAGARAAAAAGPFSCGALDPSLAVHEPSSRRRREVEFSCSNTPSSASGGGGGALGLLGAAARRRRRRQQQRDEPAAGNGYLMQYYSCYDAAEVARVFEMLSDEGDDADDRRLFSDDAVPPVPVRSGASSSSSSATPSPAQGAQLLRLAAGGSRQQQQQQQQARIAAAGSSPADYGGGAQVDRRADEFIRRFYGQLRAQKSAASTPDYYGHASSGASPYGAGAARAPRPVTAGIGA